MNSAYDVGTYVALAVSGVSTVFHLVMVFIVGWDLSASMPSALSVIEIALALCYCAVVLVLWDKLYKDKPETANSAFKVGSTLLGIIIVGCITVSGFRLGYTGGEGICKECPATVFREFNSSESCVFNSFGNTRQLWKDTEYPLDWSVKDTYFDKELLYHAYNEGKDQMTDEEDIETYGDCWYWGCACSNLHVVNTLMVWSSCTVSFLYSITTVILIMNRSPRIKGKDEGELYPVAVPVMPETIVPISVPLEDTPDTIIKKYEEEQRQIQKKLEERKQEKREKLDKRLRQRQTSSSPDTEESQSWKFKLRM